MLRQVIPSPGRGHTPAGTLQAVLAPGDGPRLCRAFCKGAPLPPRAAVCQPGLLLGFAVRRPVIAVQRACERPTSEEALS
ncbi:MAG: hypothetical protein AAFR52_09815 [Pseudomonadota bacterium]